MKKEQYIGIMSGTSLDGIDVVLTEISDGKVELIEAKSFEYPDVIKQHVLSVSLGQSTDLTKLGKLDNQLGHLYAESVLALLKETGVDKERVTAIGNHGQTVFHQPTGKTPFTIQLGDANIIAARTGITTVADFRRKDIALGGQGAPLVPAFHDALFRSQEFTTVVLNIGGIANISVLSPEQSVLGYDTGPGNLLMDAWCAKHKDLPYDKDAVFALQGSVHTPLLDELLAEPYLTKPSPKSTGRELFNLTWLGKVLEKYSCSAEDVQRTLCEYTAQTICNEVKRYDNNSRQRLLVCGGGAKNPLLMKRLKALLPLWSVESTESEGIDSQNIEAMAFAWLAYRRMHNLPSNIPQVTGASRLASLGVVYFAD
ncbi:anhydro-N-acetylmuramic acid kinase [Vibrio sp.]|uniref:anhydro-N-acetylmuramic acid kinase n=1 Tax=Vibrio sp. TaxID=678 RepID=UPI00311D9D36